MAKLKTKVSADRIVVFVLILIITVVSLFAIFTQNHSSDVEMAQVSRVLDLIQDGGLYYQNVEAKLVNKDQSVNLKIQLKDLSLEQVKVGDSVYVKQSDISGIYTYIGHSRGNILFWVLIIFFAFILVILGKDGIVYIAASLLVFLLLFSGAIYQLLTGINIYLGVFVVLGTISLVSILIQIRNLKVAAIVTASQLISLFIILIINLILFKSAFLTELFYGNLSFIESRMSLLQFWSIINSAVLFVSFGASINTTLDVAASIMKKKKTYPSTSTLNLIREGTSHNQIANARVINSLFFVFLGITLANIISASYSQGLPFWEDPAVVQGLLIFINASVSALLVGPITAVITAIALNANDNESIQLKLKRNSV